MTTTYRRSTGAKHYRPTDRHKVKPWAGRDDSAEHRNAPKEPEPPKTDAGVLASYPRRSPEGEPGEVRVTLGEFEGHPVLQIRHWVRSRSGGWIATPRGVSIPVNEIDGVVAALGKAKSLMLNDAADRSAPKSARLARPPNRVPGTLHPGKLPPELATFPPNKEPHR